jgi:hypothetical protein
MPYRHPRPRLADSVAFRASVRGVLLAGLLSVVVAGPSFAADPSATPSPTATPIPTASPAPSPTPSPTDTPTPTPTLTPPPTPASTATGTPALAPAASATPTPTPAPGALSVAMSQSGVSYDSTTNKARVRVTITPANAVDPWRYAVAVRGTTVVSGSVSGGSLSVTITNDCSITTQSVTATVTDAQNRTASAASTLDRSLCPPPPNYPHARDHIIAGPTLTEDSFVDRLRAVSSPALSEGRSIYRAMVAGGVNVAFALGTFHAESHSGTRGYATYTKNWGNILYYAWTANFGATPYSPGNGYTYAKFPTWLDSVHAYVDLLQRYDRSGYTTVSSASAHWLGTIEGSDRHLTYLNNITTVMSNLPDDAVPVMTALSVATYNRANVPVAYNAKDNLAVTGYQIGKRRGSTGTWSYQTTTAKSTTLTLVSGWWTIAVRATDAAGNWSAWKYARVAVDSSAPAMTALKGSYVVVRSVDGRFSASWSGIDNVGVTRYQYRTRSRPDGTPSSATSTTAKSATFSLAPGSWEVQVRAVDAVNNSSPWQIISVLVPRDDRAFVFSSGTVRHTATTTYRHTFTENRTPGSTLSFTTDDGDALYVIGRVGPAYGRMRVTVDGVSTIVDTGFYAGQRATTIRDRVVLYSSSLAAGPHAVTITNTGSAGRISLAIDAIDVRR